MVSNTSMNKAPQKKAAPATAKRGGKVVAAATPDDVSKRVAKKRTDDMAKKAVKKKADDMAKNAAPKKAHDVVKKAAQNKADGVVKKADAVAKKRVRKPMAAAASFKATATFGNVAKKAAEVAARRVGKAMAAAASFKAASTVFNVMNGGYKLQMSDQTCAGVHCSHRLPSHIRPAKENTREGEKNAEEPGLVQCKISSAEEKYNHRRGKIPVAPIVESNFLGLPIRPGEKDCTYYMRHGSCKYELNCRFNHPDPTAMEGSDAPSVCGNGGSGPSQGALQQNMFSFSPPRTANDSVPFVPVAFSPTQKVPPPNVEWDGYQNTTVVETPQQHSFIPAAIIAPSPTTALSPPELSSTFDSRPSPATADGTPLTSPILVEEEEDPGLVKARQHRILLEKMLKLCSQSCELEAAFEFVNTTVDYMCAEVDKMFLEEGDSVDEGIQQLGAVDPKVLQVNGLKKRVNMRRVRPRLRKKVVSKPSHLGQATRA